MGLKHEDHIYKEDFKTKEEFINSIDKKIRDVEELLSDIRNLRSDDLPDFINNEKRDDYDDSLDKLYNLTSQSLDGLYDCRGWIK